MRQIVSLILISIFTISIFIPMPENQYDDDTQQFTHEDETYRDEFKILVLKVGFANHLNERDRWSLDDLLSVFNDDAREFYQMASHNHLTELEADACYVELTNVKAPGGALTFGSGDVNSQDHLYDWAGKVEYQTQPILQAALLKLEEQFETEETICIDSSGNDLESNGETFAEFLGRYLVDIEPKKGYYVYMVLNGPDCRGAARSLSAKDSGLDATLTSVFRFAHSCEAKGLGSLGFNPKDVVPPFPCNPMAAYQLPEECKSPHFEKILVKAEDAEFCSTWCEDEVHFKWVIPDDYVGQRTSVDYSIFKTKTAYDDSSILKLFIHEMAHMMGISHTSADYLNPFSPMASSAPAQFTSYTMLDQDVNWLSSELIEEIYPTMPQTLAVTQEVDLWFLEDWDYSDEDPIQIRTIKIPLRNSYISGDDVYPLELSLVETEYLLIEARTWQIGVPPSDLAGTVSRAHAPTSASDYWHCKDHTADSDYHYEYLETDADCIEYHQSPYPNVGPLGKYTLPDEGVLISRINLRDSEGSYPSGQDAAAVTPVDTTPGDEGDESKDWWSLMNDALLDLGESFQLEFNERNITVEVTKDITDDSGVRLGYTVNIIAKQVGDGEPELRLPINTLDEDGWVEMDGPYYHPEMWVDSEIYGGFCVDSNTFTPEALASALSQNNNPCIENMDSEDGNTKNIGGDTPKLGQANKICLTAFNAAPSYYDDDEDGPAKIVFKWKTQNSGYDSDKFSKIGEVLFPDLNGGEQMNLCVDWIPELDEELIDEESNADGLIDVYSCVIALLYLDNDDDGIIDNEASQGFMENFGYFTTTQGSPYHPVEHSFEVYNPFQNQTYIWLEVGGLEPGWTYELGWDGANISGHSAWMNSITIIPPQDASFSAQSYVPLDSIRVDIRAFTLVVANDDEMLVEEIGGIVMEVVPSQKSTMTHSVPDIVVQLGEPLIVTGVVMNGVPGTMVTALLTTPSGELHTKAVPLGESGEFTLSAMPHRMSNESGIWIVQMAYLGAQAVAESSTSKTTFEVLPRNIRETQTIDVGAVFEIRGSVDSDIGFSDNRMQITYISPTGEITTRETLIQEDGNYSDDFEFSEHGEWRVDYSYMDVNGSMVLFSQSVNVLQEAEDGDSSSSLAFFLLAITALFVLISVATKGRGES